jgi:hypothetical protein
MKSFLLIKKGRLITENFASKFNSINKHCINEEGARKLLQKFPQ